MIASLLAELEKMRRRGALWLLLLVWSLMTVAFGYLIPYLIYRSPSADTGDTSRADMLASILPHAFVENMIAGFPLFGAAVALIGGALLVGSEYSWGTLQALITQRPGRLHVLGGKLLALAVLALAFTLPPFVLGAISSSIVAAIEDAPMDWPAAGTVIEVVAAGWLILGVAAVAGLFVAVLFKSASVPIGLGLVYLLVIENLVRGFSGSSTAIADIEKALPGANAGALASALVNTRGVDAPGLDTAVGGGQAVLVLIAYIAVFAGIAAILWKRRDVTGIA